MKFLVVGVGAQGSTIATQLVKNPDVSEVRLADISLERAKQFANSLKSGKVSMHRVDAGNVDEILKVAKGVDVVVNATLPRFNLNIMNVALKSRSHYIDLATNVPVYESIMKELALSDKFKRIGLTAVINQGGPFVMNVLVRYAADRLDQVDEISLRFGWQSELIALEKTEEVVPTWAPFWCPEIALLEWVNEPLIYKNGKFEKVPPFSGMEEYNFPDLGAVTVCWVEYEPVVTLPRFIGKGVRYVDCKIPPDIMAGALIKMGFASDKLINVKGVKVAPRDVLLALTPPAVKVVEEMEAREIPSRPACFLTEVSGEKAGEKICYTLYLTLNMREIYEKFGKMNAFIGVPVEVTATMLARGEVKAKGVIPPEGLEPEPFLAKLAAKGITFKEKVTKEIRVT